MASIATQYRERNRGSYLMPCDDSLCFLADESGSPSVVALTSSPSRSVGTCRSCVAQRTPMILEVHRPTRHGRTEEVLHRHIQPECDILREIRQAGLPAAVMSARGWRAAEGLAWRLFWRGLDLAEDAVLRDRPAEHMLAAIERGDGGLFDMFYRGLYQPLLLNRRYLLIVR